MNQTPDIWVLYSTFATADEAILAARSLLEKHLVACANVLPGATSVYRWEGQTEEQSEVVMIAKTTINQKDAAITALKSLHSYQLPCITAWPVAAGFAGYLNWVAAECASKP